MNGMMTQQRKAPITKPEDLNLNTGTSMVGG